MFPGPYTTGVVVATPPTTNTTWYNSQTTYRPPKTATNFNNLTTVSIVQARTSYCPLSDQDQLDGMTIYDLPDACADLLDPYCNPNLAGPALPSTRFPAICTPTNATTASATPPPTNAVPAPLEPSTIASCKKYYQVLSGDNCYSIANNFKITLTQVLRFLLSDLDHANYNRSSTHGIHM
ncbi:MAG: hypothetical protein L6R41_004446 [Letrouitia leprolyta]|nr:MAG: hypothetical protein L6R41_004446 [Letrouitia leprolyta]